MSTMTLQLPINYADVDREEMEYFDGGYTMSRSTILGLPAISWRLNGAETAQFLSDAAWGAGILTAAAGFAAGPAWAIVGVILGSYGFIISRCNSNYSGVTIKVPLYTTSIPPIIYDNY